MLQPSVEKPPTVAPLPPSAADSSAVAALRAELQAELQGKRQCSYAAYECTQLSLDGRRHCLRHVLEDVGAPYGRCTYVYANSGKRCHLPAPKGDRKDHAFCGEHALRSAMQRNRQAARYPPPRTAETLLASLSHHVKKPRTRTASTTSGGGGTPRADGGRSATPEEVVEGRTVKPVDPFADIDAAALQHSNCNQVLDMCSESDSDVEASTYASVWHDAQADSSDNESIDSEQEDPLKHANIYTADEITSITRDKLVRLQSLYIEQYRHLQHLLREKRRRYLHSLKKEKENCCSISAQPRDNPKEQRLYQKLKAYNSYHRTYGEEAVAARRARVLRMRMNEGGTVQKHGSYTKCCFTEGGVKCGERALPVARHCRKHILQDTNQVLFKPCGKVCGDVECMTPVEGIFEDATCRLHMEIPPIRSYNQVRKDSESDYDESIDQSNSSGMPISSVTDFTGNVKSELIDCSLPMSVPDIDNIPSVFGKSFPFEDEKQKRGLWMGEINAKDEESRERLDMEQDDDSSTLSVEDLEQEIEAELRNAGLKKEDDI